MLNAEETMLLNEVVTALLNHDETELAKRVNTALTTSAHVKLKISQERATRPKRGKVGAPTLAYVIDFSPGALHHAKGVRAAHTILKEELTRMGASPAHLPTRASLAVYLSSRGTWSTTAETENGVVSISVRKE